jgi:ankyrin repeat protein
MHLFGSISRTALHLAAERGHLDVVELLIHEVRPPPPAPETNVGMSKLRRTQLNASSNLAFVWSDGTGWEMVLRGEYVGLAGGNLRGAEPLAA